MRVRIKMKNKLEGKNLFLLEETKKKKIFDKKTKKTKTIKTKLEKTIHYKLVLKDKIKNIKTFTKRPRKKLEKKRMTKMEKLIHDKM
jgi:plasmid maintenance system killer protein